MSPVIRIAGALLAPLALGACGLPIGVQIASLFADGVSYLTTDKSLTDHGISAVTGEDCAIWRGVEGGDICRETGDEKDSETIMATLGQLTQPQRPEQEQMLYGDADLPAELSGAAPAPRSEPTIIAALAEPKREPAAMGMALSGPDSMILGRVSPVAPAEMPPVRRKTDTAQPAASAGNPAMPVQAAVPAPTPVLAAATTPLPALPAKAKAVKAVKATYYIIASYHRADDAARFSKNHDRWQPRVIEGSAKGHQVFRVAVGPIDKAAGHAMKKRLKKAGFKDTWRLTFDSVPVETEMAALH